MAYDDQRVDRLPSTSREQITVGGTHLKPGELAGPGRRYGNLPGTCAAVVRPPTVEAMTDGEVPLVVLDLPETVLVAIARAVHLGAGADGARAFGRVATGDRNALRGLLADHHVRESLTLTLAAESAVDLAGFLRGAAEDAETIIAEAQTETVNPDDARDSTLADELFGMGEHPEVRGAVTR